MFVAHTSTPLRDNAAFPAGLTYEFTRRSRVQLHNGNAFTAEGSRFSWQKA